ncbi:hypothetical protein BJV78DRAFT_1127732 [Lactifluus subvellereus]|nr:hypothetical protein BJV78DRAFT_1127732 [Lactifluus subvellereus]
MAPGVPLLPPPLKHGACGRTSGTSTLVIRDHKRRVSWCTSLAVILVPLTLVLLTFSTRFVSRSLFTDLLAAPSPESRVHFAGGAYWSGHTAHALHRRLNGSTVTIPSSVSTQASSSSPLVIVFPSLTPTTTQNDSHSVPTIPTSPPVLPTPFPQPFDTTLSSNFTTNSCELFFTNMTLSSPFRQCRPFSFLSQTSSAFIRTQTNSTALNIDIWGTCNTPVGADQCVANMAWFASDLLVACSREKNEGNQLVLQALASLQTYSLMREVACLPDKNTSAYCYIEAASSSNPADLYIYSLPFGMPLPNNTAPACSDCSKSVMTLFGAQANQTDGLKQTYNAAIDRISSKCGANFVHPQSSLSSSSSAMPRVGDKATSRWVIGATLCALFIGML